MVKQVNRENIGPSMKKRSLRYAGDKAVRAVLERYACPTSFHVIRTRLLGNIADAQARRIATPSYRELLGR